MPEQNYFPIAIARYQSYTFVCTCTYVHFFSELSLVAEYCDREDA